MKDFLRYHLKDRAVLFSESYMLTSPGSETPILVFTMAKAASTSVYRSLKHHGRKQVFHIHSLDESEISAGVAKCLKNGIYPGRRSPVGLINRKIVSKRRPFKIISLYRNPIDRNISAFFDAFELFLGVPAQNYPGSLEELEKAFHDNISHTYAIDWYGKQFFEGTAINVYELPFNSDEEFTVFKKGHIEVLLMHSEIPNPKKEALIGDFCDIKDFNIIDANITAESNGGKLYKDFRNHIRYTEGYLNSLLDSPYMNHFFSEGYKERLFKTWLK
ncbi:MAG: putative capsular polysaccharide synthesis family protein [Flavobacteriaceae bacterium]